MRVVGRSGIVMDLPVSLARGLLRSGVVEVAQTPTPRVERATGDEQVPTAAQVRRWAKQAGVDCPARGQVPQHVVDAYQDAHK